MTTYRIRHYPTGFAYDKRPCYKVDTLNKACHYTPGDSLSQERARKRCLDHANRASIPGPTVPPTPVARKSTSGMG